MDNKELKGPSAIFQRRNEKAGARGWNEPPRRLIAHLSRATDGRKNVLQIEVDDVSVPEALVAGGFLNVDLQ
jgi:hypothetical protein